MFGVKADAPARRQLQRTQQAGGIERMIKGVVVDYTDQRRPLA